MTGTINAHREQVSPKLHATMAKNFSPRKSFRRKTGNKRKGKFTTARRAKIGKPSKGLALSRYMYAPRSVSVYADIAAAASPAGWLRNPSVNPTQVMHDGVYQLNQVPDHANFQALYESYRINAVKVELLPGGTVVTPQLSTQAQVNLQTYTFYDPSGNYAGLMPSEAALLEKQSAKRRSLLAGGTSSLKVYSKLRQANVTLKDSLITYSYTQQKPKWISTSDVLCKHYGPLVVLCSYDGLALPAIPLRVVTTYYLEFKGVK